MAADKILLLNGPNLNLLGEREPHIYGNSTLKDIELGLSKMLAGSALTLVSHQSNHEGGLIDKVQDLRNELKGLIINPGAYSHTSIALRDCLSALSCPKVEVHISNIYTREDFRHHSYVSEVVDSVICGAGVLGYELGLQFLLSKV